MSQYFNEDYLIDSSQIAITWFVVVLLYHYLKVENVLPPIFEPRANANCVDYLQYGRNDFWPCRPKKRRRRYSAKGMIYNRTFSE